MRVQSTSIVGTKTALEAIRKSLVSRACVMEALESRTFCDAALAAAATHAAVAPKAVTAPIKHTLTPDGAGNSLSAARNIGALSAKSAFKDAVGAGDTNDYYKFSVSASANVSVALTGLSANADIQLIRDANGDGAVANSDVIGSGLHGGTTNESIGKTLAAGTYYVRVFSSAASANYTLTLAASLAAAPPVQTGGGGTTTGGSHAGIQIVFDYRYDTSGFFTSHPEAKALLNQAASAFSRFSDILTSITPGNGNTWSETFINPDGSGTLVTLNNPTVANNTIVIYVGGSNYMGGTELGRGGPGGWNASGSEQWINTVAARGQTGALKPTATDFGPWGGAISFSTNTSWNLTAGAPSAGQNDFLSVATHEIAHVLGFGTAASWVRYVSKGSFVGAHAESVNSGRPVALSPDLSHWVNGSYSTVNGASQLAEMNPILNLGTRRALTTLDFAGLQDVGWTMV